VRRSHQIKEDMGSGPAGSNAVWVMDTHVHLALALAVTYPNHCPASCWTNNHFIYKENYINSLCHTVRLLTSCLFMSFLCISAWVKCGLLPSLWHDIKISFITLIFCSDMKATLRASCNESLEEVRGNIALYSLLAGTATW